MKFTSTIHIEKQSSKIKIYVAGGSYGLQIIVIVPAPKELSDDARWQAVHLIIITLLPGK